MFITQSAGRSSEFRNATGAESPVYTEVQNATIAYGRASACIQAFVSELLFPCAHVVQSLLLFFGARSVRANGRWTISHDGFRRGPGKKIR